MAAAAACQEETRSQGAMVWQSTLSELEMDVVMGNNVSRPYKSCLLNIIWSTFDIYQELGWNDINRSANQWINPQECNQYSMIGKQSYRNTHHTNNMNICKNEIDIKPAHRGISKQDGSSQTGRELPKKLHQYLTLQRSPEARAPPTPTPPSGLTGTVSQHQILGFWRILMLANL